MASSPVKYFKIQINEWEAEYLNVILGRMQHLLLVFDYFRKFICQERDIVFQETQDNLDMMFREHEYDKGHLLILILASITIYFQRIPGYAL